MRVITFFNNKGGVGKTTLAVNVASYFATKLDKRVMFIDCDPQANSTQMMVPDEMWADFYGEEATKSTILNYLSPIVEGDSTIDFIDQFYSKEQNKFCVDLIPGHPSLSIIEDIFSDSWNKCLGGDLGGFRKTNWLKMFKNKYDIGYDYLIIDVGPSLGALNRSILLNSDFIVSPMGSDIFSLIGISNISSWISNWMRSYNRAIEVLNDKYERNSISKYPINLNTEATTRLIGYSIQQYVTRSFADGRRPIAAFDKIITQIPEAISSHLGYLFYNGLKIENLNLGDVPFLYSLVPLAQSSKSPMYSLTRSEGVVGGQTSSVRQYREMLDAICHRILSNIGDE